LICGRVPRTEAPNFPFEEKDGWDGQHLHFFTPKELKLLLHSFGIAPKAVCHVGRFQLLKRAFPTLLDSAIALVGTKTVG
jgi:hypothetical protein